MAATCKTCPFWERREGESVEGVPDPGYCHHSRAFSEEDPQRRGDWWCSEHPLRQRDRLAVVALQGLLASPTRTSSQTDIIARSAYQIADAMLAAREPQP